MNGKVDPVSNSVYPCYSGYLFRLLGDREAIEASGDLPQHNQSLERNRPSMTFARPEMPFRTAVFFVTFMLSAQAFATPTHADSKPHFSNRAETSYVPTVADDWIGVLLNVTAVEVNRNGARPTVLSRISFIVTSSMYDAWAAYDKTAVPSAMDPNVRPSKKAMTKNDQEVAICYAAYRALLDVFPSESEILRNVMHQRGLNPDDNRRDHKSPQGIGNLAAEAVINSRRSDKSNQRGDMPGSSGTPYSDYTGYNPVNSVDKIVDPDRWQPIVFTAPDGKDFTPSYLTPFWGNVTTFGLKSGSQYRPGPQPRVGSQRLMAEVDQVIAENADLTLDEKAIVEFMRDGPKSTSQSGQWQTFARYVSRRDRHDLDKDIKMYFGLGVIGLDTFIASWEAKLHYDSSRPWTLVRHYFGNEKIRGWGGPGKGTVSLKGSEWHPYAPLNFITPPFPGYVSGHSTVSGGSGRFLELFTGSDSFGYEELWTVGSLTEPEFPCASIQRSEGKPDPPKDLNCKITVKLPTFSKTADMAGFSRILGGFHIQADNLEGLKMGRAIADYNWEVIKSYIDGSARGRGKRNRYN